MAKGTMIRTVAVALEERATRGAAMPPWTVMAKIAIQAMREPTVKMLMGSHDDDDATLRLWQELIDIALWDE